MNFDKPNQPAWYKPMLGDPVKVTYLGRKSQGHCEGYAKLLAEEKLSLGGCVFYPGEVFLVPWEDHSCIKERC